MTTDPPATGAIALLDLKAGAAAPCPHVSLRCAWYSAYRARRSWPTLAVAAFDGEVPIPSVSAAENVTVFGRMVSGGLPITAITALQDLSSLQFARPAYATTSVEDMGS
jgi:hypothetical protein